MRATKLVESCESHSMAVLLSHRSIERCNGSNPHEGTHHVCLSNSGNTITHTAFMVPKSALCLQYRASPARGPRHCCAAFIAVLCAANVLLWASILPHISLEARHAEQHAVITTHSHPWLVGPVCWPEHRPAVGAAVWRQPFDHTTATIMPSSA